ncbi:Dyp-type peroxidase [Arthrobacter sp. STN4]|uniref:Dyp-type peroxidase n=1 Tax=Arthrobacter sp. STN4 TaxID=2923276 RepID=UPI002119D107|nr:Dyp-type peroxidase [Arthrobacter sp. STN4]MCQ9164747.1 Dyp-type peroxidase [Arthrobacter sp. STN4]
MTDPEPVMHNSASETPTARPGRRSFLIGAGTGAAATALAATAANAAIHPTRITTPDSPSAPAVPFHGTNQAGVYRPATQQRQACFAAFRVLAADQAELKTLLQVLTSQGARLAKGVQASEPVPAEDLPAIAGGPPSNSGVLGEDVPPGSFTMTVGLGASLFDNLAYGLAGKKPKGLTGMRVFPNDTPDPTWTGGDLLLQLCADSADMIHYALREITKATRGLLALSWKINGFHSAPRPAGNPRNLFGYKDGIVNPRQDDHLVWITPESGQPDWAVGGTFIVVRLIRMLVEFWDRVGLGEQDGMIGRHRASGAPLGAVHETDTPDYANDPEGQNIPLDAHIRLANPRTKSTDASRLLRRGYNYDLGVDLNGNLQAGLIFTSFQRNIQSQFEATQLRLVDEPMTDYIEPFGGGYFIGLPGVQAADGFLGEGLFN